MTASKAGTSTPSDKHRAFDKIRQIEPCAEVSAFNHSNLLFLSKAFCLPSTWSKLHCKNVSSSGFNC